MTGQRLQLARDLYYVNRTGPLTATLVEAVCYLPMTRLTSSWSSILQDLSTDNTSVYLPSDFTDELRRGYEAQYSTILQLLSAPTQGAIEVMADSIGTIQVAQQYPLSRGYVHPKSSDILDGVEVDPRYGAHPFDLDTLSMGLQWNQQLVRTSAMMKLNPVLDENLMSDDQVVLKDLVRSQIGTGFYPCGTLAMLPRELGGVVGTDLKVYGTQNLRVVDSSIIPVIPSAHLQSVVYAVAEKGADLIKSQR